LTPASTGVGHSASTPLSLFHQVISICQQFDAAINKTLFVQKHLWDLHSILRRFADQHLPWLHITAKQLSILIILLILTTIMIILFLMQFVLRLFHLTDQFYLCAKTMKLLLSSYILIQPTRTRWLMNWPFHFSRAVLQKNFFCSLMTLRRSSLVSIFMIQPASTPLCTDYCKVMHWPTSIVAHFNMWSRTH